MREQHTDRHTHGKTYTLTDIQTDIQTDTKVITDRSPFRAFGVTSLQPTIKERSKNLFKPPLVSP